MKIAIDVRMMWSSGIGSYIRNLVPKVIRNLPEARFCLLGRPEEMKRWEGFIPGPNIEWIEVKAQIFTIFEQVELTQKIPKDTNLLWCPNYNFPIFWHGKLLATVHDVFHLAHPEFVSGIHRRFYAKYMFRALVRKAKTIFCVSNFTKGELLQLAGGDKAKMKVVYNGVDGSWFNIKKADKPYPHPYLLFVGNVKPHKNLGHLLEAFDLIKGKIPHDLVIVGKKEGFITGDREVVRQAEAFGGRVRFTGVLEDDQLQQYYVFADLLVFPSLYEGFGLPPLEAMAAGIPVACSKTASLPEVCDGAAIYFDPFDPKDIAEKIMELLKNNALWETLKEKGLRRAKGFSWDECAKKTSQLIDQLLV